MLRVQFTLYNSHARPGVQRAPSLLSALSQERSAVSSKASGASRREKAKSYLSESFRDGPQDQTSDAQLRIRESRDSGAQLRTV